MELTKEHMNADALFPSASRLKRLFLVKEISMFFCPFISNNKKEVLHDPNSFIEPDVGQALPSSAIR